MVISHLSKISRDEVQNLIRCFAADSIPYIMISSPLVTIFLLNSNLPCNSKSYLNTTRLSTLMSTVKYMFPHSTLRRLGHLSMSPRSTRITLLIRQHMRMDLSLETVLFMTRGGAYLRGLSERSFVLGDGKLDFSKT